MGMTTNEVIEILRAESGDVSCNTVGVARWMEAIDMAISALRQQETVIKCHDLFDEDGGDIYPGKANICSSTNLPCCRCNPGPCEHRKETVTERNELTNAQKIRAMTDEELAKLLLDGCRGSKCENQTQNEWGSVNCFQCRLDWLQQPAKEADHESV